MQDYAAHKINANLKLKEVHRKLLKNKLTEAALEIDEAIVELRLMKAAVTDLKEKIDENNNTR